MNNGSLTYADYYYFLKKKFINTDSFDYNQIQPSSVDLTLSNECYMINASFLAHNERVKSKLEKYSLKKINIKKGFVFKKNKTYLVRIRESLNLPYKIFGKCNPKSSTGRLNIFCRTILDKCDEYEKIPFNYKGNIFLEITSRSFDIFLKEGDSLNQMRLVKNSNNFLNDVELTKLHKKNPILFNNSKKALSANISSGLKVSVDLNNKDKITAFKAKNSTPILYFSKIKYHKISEFWKPIKTNKKSLVILPDEFFILKSKQKIKIPDNMAGEMIPYDTGIGDFRAHYAGFFDPGFGSNFGSYAVLEVRTNEVSFNLEHDQIVARLYYEKLDKIPSKVYGNKISSNYQNQGLALSKHFKVIDY